jgi:hypothetical protein
MAVELYGGALAAAQSAPPLLCKVQVSETFGPPGWQFLGYPASLARSSQERIAAALQAAGWRIRARKLLFNFSPAVPKSLAPQLDLVIALGYLAVFAEVSLPARSLFVGTLDLSGKLDSPESWAVFVNLALQNNFSHLYFPFQKVVLSLSPGKLQLCFVHSLTETVLQLQGHASLLPIPFQTPMKKFSPFLAIQHLSELWQLTLLVAAKRSFFLFGRGDKTAAQLFLQMIADLQGPLSLAQKWQVFAFFQQFSLSFSTWNWQEPVVIELLAESAYRSAHSYCCLPFAVLSVFPKNLPAFLFFDLWQLNNKERKILATFLQQRRLQDSFYPRCFFFLKKCACGETPCQCSKQEQLRFQNLEQFWRTEADWVIIFSEQERRQWLRKTPKSVSLRKGDFFARGQKLAVTETAAVFPLAQEAKGFWQELVEKGSFSQENVQTIRRLATQVARLSNKKFVARKDLLRALALWYLGRKGKNVL